MNHIMSKVCQGWSYTSNHTSDEDGRIIVIWKYPTSVQMLNKSKQSLTCSVTITPSMKFVYSAIYASNTAEERTDMWVELINLQQSLSLQSVPWLVGGDMNQILHLAEHSNLDVRSFNPGMIELKDCLLHLGLFDLRFHGLFNTCKNNQHEDPIVKSWTERLQIKVGFRVSQTALHPFYLLNSQTTPFA